MLYEVLRTAKMGAGKAPDLYTAIMAQKMPFAKGSGAEEHEYTGAVPVTFTANGQPLLDYLISGNEEHSGTPTSDSPIMPQGTGKRTGNLLPNQFENGGIQQSDGSLFDSDYRARTTDYIALSAGTYTISGTYKFALRVYDSSKNYIAQQSSSVWSENSMTFTIADGYIKLVVANYDTNTYIPVAGLQVMLNLGSTALPYEPYGYKIPISSANTTTPIYLGEVETTRKVKKLVLDGTEDWWLSSMDSNRTVCRLSLNGTNVVGYCTHIEWKSIYEAQDYNRIVFSDYLGGSLYVSLENSILSGQTVADFKSYLAQQYAAGTPVTIWYVLETPETAVVNELLMKIGDYVDTVSMEQAGVEIPTAKGTNTLDVLTDVKPSNVYLKYKEV